MTTNPESDEEIVSPKQRLSLGSLGFPKRGHRPLSHNHAGLGPVNEQGDADQSTSPAHGYPEPTVEKGRGQDLAREKFIGTESLMGNISFTDPSICDMDTMASPLSMADHFPHSPRTRIASTRPQPASAHRSTPSTSPRPSSHLDEYHQDADTTGGQEASDNTRAMEGKRRSQAKRDCQIALLGDINKTLGLFTRKWTMFAAAVAEKKKHPARSETDVEEMRRALEALWSRLESKVHRCCVKLEEIRSETCSGPPWHNKNGVYLDLPLGFYRHQRSRFRPDRLKTLTESAFEQARSGVRMLDVLLQQASNRSSSTKRYSAAEFHAFLARIGLTIEWRRKLGSIDVIEY